MSQEHVIRVSIQESGLASANKALSETEKLLTRVADATSGMDSAFGRAAGNVVNASSTLVNGLQGVTGALTALDSSKKAVKAAMDSKIATTIRSTAATVKEAAAAAKSAAAQAAHSKAVAMFVPSKYQSIHPQAARWVSPS